MKVHSHLQARDNYFGFQIGLRFGDRESRSIQGDYPNAWYNPVMPVRALRIDRRRRPSNWSYFSQMNDFLKSLKRIEGSGVAGYDIGDRWASGGDDYGLVCVLVNEEHSGGTKFNAFKFFAASSGIASKYDVSRVGTHGHDHMPTISLRTSKVRRYVTETVAHELGHALDLTDIPHINFGSVFLRPPCDE